MNTNKPENDQGADFQLSDELEEFAILKSLVQELRESVPWQTDQHRQAIGLYMLAALRLGKGFPENLLFNDSDLPKRPHLNIVV